MDPIQHSVNLSFLVGHAKTNSNIFFIFVSLSFGIEKLGAREGIK